MSVDVDVTVAFLRAIGFGEGCRYLSPAPLYHSAPIYWTMAVHRLGAPLSSWRPSTRRPRSS